MAMVQGHSTIVQSASGSLAGTGIKVAFTSGRPFAVVNWGVVIGAVVSSGTATVQLRGAPQGATTTGEAAISAMPGLTTGATLGGTAGNTFINYVATELTGDPALANVIFNPGETAVVEVTVAAGGGGANSMFFLEAIVFSGYGRTLQGETAGSQVSLTRTWNTSTAYTAAGTVYLIN